MHIAQYANITQKRLRSNYAKKLGFTQFYYAERNYAIITQITPSLRRGKYITQILRK